MSPNTDILEQQFQDMVGVPVQVLLKDIEHNPPYGTDLKLNGVYSAINSERKSDDPSIPRGQWDHKLDTANWDEVGRIAVDALSNKSKDLQIAIWLLEAQLHKNGFSAIAPCIHFIHQLTKDFWDGLYPKVENGDLDHRFNLIAWVNDKLQPVVKQLPLTLTRNDHVFSWADWEMAAYFEQLPPEQRKDLGNDYIQINSIITAILGTPIEFYKNLFLQLDMALKSIDDYAVLLDELFGRDAPSLNGLRSLLSDVYETLYSHVKHRGIEAASNEDEPQNANNETMENAPAGSGSGGGSGPIKGRTDAYARLSEAAEYLAMDDPHSPVPYLVYKAIQWGQLNTAELYQELFVQYQGQLNIFEILGLDISQQTKKK